MSGFLDFSRIRAVTFDCYGTLVDWEAGILGALGRVFGTERVHAERERIIRLYATHERDAQAGPYRPYRDVLAEVTRRLARDVGAALRPGDENVLAESIRDWPAFEETPGALRALRNRFRLAVLSNIDDDLFEDTRPKLGVVLDEMVTAQQVRSYKPGRAHFDEALRRLALPPSAVLHVAESRYHDIAPAKALGFATVWVNRHGASASASGEGEAEAGLEVGGLTALANRVEAWERAESVKRKA